MNWSSHAPNAVSFTTFAATITASYYLHIYTGSVVRRNLLAAPLNTLYWILIISFLTFLPLNLYVNLSSALQTLLLIFGLDSGVWPGCWISAKIFCNPVSRKRSGSATTQWGRFENGKQQQYALQIVENNQANVLSMKKFTIIRQKLFCIHEYCTD